MVLDNLLAIDHQGHKGEKEEMLFYFVTFPSAIGSMARARRGPG
jgi:hypothetical protein